MTISDFQVTSIIRSYTRNLKVKARTSEKKYAGKNNVHDDKTIISDKAFKKLLFDRISENVMEKIKRHA